jgi:hypothetical protein
VKDEQLYSVSTPRLASMEQRVALGVRRCEAFVRATQRKGLPATFGTGKPPTAAA